MKGHRRLKCGKRILLILVEVKDHFKSPISKAYTWHFELKIRSDFGEGQRPFVVSRGKAVMTLEKGYLKKGNFLNLILGMWMTQLTKSSLSIWWSQGHLCSQRSKGETFPLTPVSPHLFCLFFFHSS